MKTNLVEVEGQLQLRALDIALRDFRQALVKLERPSPSDDDFAVARSALLVLDKTLDPMDPKDPLLVQPVADAKAWQREGRLTIDKRRLELDVQLQQGKVEAARKEAGDLIAQFGAPESGEDQLKQAEAAVKKIGALLEAGAALVDKDRAYAAYDREVKKRITELERKLAVRRLQLDAAAARAALTAALATVKEKLDAAREPASTDADVEAAAKAAEAANQFLEEKGPLEVQAGSYATAAERGRGELLRRLETLELARQEREARKHTVDAYTPAVAAMTTAEGSKDLRVQKREYEKAAGLLKSCRDDGGKLLEAVPQYGRLPVVVGGRPGTLKEVVVDCGQRYDAVAPLLKPLAALIAFEDGPRKAYEAATAFLAKGQKTEALAQFDECTATGVTLGVRNPDLRERTFAVAGKQMTLSQLTTVCTAKSRELLGKR